MPTLRFSNTNRIWKYSCCTWSHGSLVIQSFLHLQLHSRNPYLTSHVLFKWSKYYCFHRRCYSIRHLYGMELDTIRCKSFLVELVTAVESTTLPSKRTIDALHLSWLHFNQSIWHLSYWFRFIILANILKLVPIYNELDWLKLELQSVTNLR